MRGTTVSKIQKKVLAEVWSRSPGREHLFQTLNPLQKWNSIIPCLSPNLGANVHPLLLQMNKKLADWINQRQMRDVYSPLYVSETLFCCGTSFCPSCQNTWRTYIRKGNIIWERINTHNFPFSLRHDASGTIPDRVWCWMLTSLAQEPWRSLGDAYCGWENASSTRILGPLTSWREKTERQTEGGEKWRQGWLYNS